MAGGHRAQWGCRAAADQPPHARPNRRRHHDAADGWARVGAQIARRDRDRAYPRALPLGRAGEEASVDGLRAGADDYLVKPFSRHELLARVEARLATARQGAAERQARSHAEQTIKAREEFFAALAHELRNPAASLFTWIDRLRDREASDKSGALDILESAAHTIRRLAEDLLDVARGTSGHVGVIRERYASLAPLVQGVIEAFGPAAAQKDITLIGKLQNASGPAEVDADRLQQIVSNLLSNAIRFTPTGGRIEVHCGRRLDCIELLVRDTGKGIAAEALPHVFERYWQGQPPLDADSGLGLGLSICRMLVDQHQGKIDVMSDGPGQGTTFVVRLPLAAAASDKRVKRRNVPLPTRIRDAAFSASCLAGRQAGRPFRTGS